MSKLDRLSRRKIIQVGFTEENHKILKDAATSLNFNPNEFIIQATMEKLDHINTQTNIETNISKILSILKQKPETEKKNKNT